jgi:hypothetical protein
MQIKMRWSFSGLSSASDSCAHEGQQRSTANGLNLTFFPSFRLFVSTLDRDSPRLLKELHVAIKFIAGCKALQRQSFD